MTSLLTAYRRAHAERCDLPRGSLKEFKAALNKVAKGLGESAGPGPGSGSQGPDTKSRLDNLPVRVHKASP